jgi:hypothetical protein
MYPAREITGDVRTTGSHISNNQVGRERDAKVYAFLRLVRAATIVQFVAAGIFSSEERGRRRLKRLEQRKKIRCAGYADFDGKLVKVFCSGRCAILEHEIEITEIFLRMRVTRILWTGIPDELQKYNIDRLIEVGEKKFVWEHDRGTEDWYQIRAKMQKLADCRFDVLWTCPDDERIARLKAAAPNDRHWFTTYAQARLDPHAPCWQNNAEEIEALDRASA